jgi:hypothetical protein
MQDTALDSKPSILDGKDTSDVVAIPPAVQLDPETARLAQLSAKLDNPLGEFSIEELSQQADEFCQLNGLMEHGMLL